MAGAAADPLGLRQVQWDHPNMPWDDTSLWVADVAADGSLAQQRRVRCSVLRSVLKTDQGFCPKRPRACDPKYSDILTAILRSCY